METIPAKLDNHLPPIEHQIAEQPNAIEPEPAEELAESVEEDALSDVTLTEERMANIEETGALGAPRLTEITESVNTELPTQSVTRSGQVSS